jgi:hypothetical protein
MFAYRYAQAADRRDWRGLTDCYTEDAVVNFNGTIVEGRDAIIARNKVQLTKWEATQHFTGNPVIRVDGDRADASFYTIAQAGNPVVPLLPPDVRHQNPGISTPSNPGNTTPSLEVAHLFLAPVTVKLGSSGKLRGVTGASLGWLSRRC